MRKLTVLERVANLKYFEQRLRIVTTGANIHDIANVLCSIRMLIEFPIDLQEGVMDTNYVSIINKAEKYL